MPCRAGANPRYRTVAVLAGSREAAMHAVFPTGDAARRRSAKERRGKAALIAALRSPASPRTAEPAAASGGPRCCLDRRATRRDEGALRSEEGRQRLSSGPQLAGKPADGG